MHNLNRSGGRIVIVFDGDDTLWETQSLYTDAKNRFYEDMMALGFPRDVAKARFESIDHANVTRFGFTRRRFPQSMSDAYRALCAEYGVNVDETKESNVRSIGAAVFQTPPRIYEGAGVILSELRDRGARLILATKGDPEVQVQRVESSRLRHYFSRVHILADKGAKEFQKIVIDDGIDLAAAWSVGNSLRSDINPALAIGLNAIWIPHNTWAYEEEEADINPKLHVAESLFNVPAIILGNE